MNKYTRTNAPGQTLNPSQYPIFFVGAARSLRNDDIPARQAKDRLSISLPHCARLLDLVIVATSTPHMGVPFHLVDGIIMHERPFPKDARRAVARRDILNHGARDAAIGNARIDTVAPRRAVSSVKRKRRPGILKHVYSVSPYDGPLQTHPNQSTRSERVTCLSASLRCLPHTR